MSDRGCAVTGCERRHLARGWCSAHWERWSRHGDPEYRVRGEVRDGRRVCPSCQADVLLGAYGPGARECRPCQARRAAAYRARHPHVPVERQPAVCDTCGEVFAADRRRWRYCSPDCAELNRHRANWKYVTARRARLRDAFVEAFDREEIFERDGWRCRIGDHPIDRNASWPDPASASLDHIVPIARGGQHSRANAQAACAGCNVRKGASLT